MVVHCIDDRGPRLARQAGSDQSEDLQPVLQQEVWERAPDSQRLKKALKNERGFMNLNNKFVVFIDSSIQICLDSNIEDPIFASFVCL